MDMWCDFCDDRPKSATVKVDGVNYEVCNNCVLLTVSDKEK